MTAAAPERSAVWPALRLPTDHPRSAGHVARLTCAVRRPRSAFGGAEEGDLLTCFAAVLHRWSGQEAVTAALDGRRICVLVDPAAPLAALDPVRGVTVNGADEVALHADADIVELRYDAALFSVDTAERLLLGLQTLTLDASQRPQTCVGDLAVSTDEQLHTVLVEWNDTARPGGPGCLHEDVEAVARATPHAVAVVQSGRRWTYREIDVAATALAHRLRDRGLAADTRIGLCLPRGAEYLIAALGVLKAGSAFVPLDPGHPRERLAAMLAGTDCAAVLTDPECITALPDGRKSLLVAELAEPYGTVSPLPVVDPEALCYLIHTSGSTGAPKPIALRHAGVTNNIRDLVARYGLGGEDRVLALSSPNFDMSVFEFFGVTAAGGTVVVPDADRHADPAHWADLVQREGISVWNSAPALLALLVDHLETAGGAASQVGCLRVALLGGDWVPVDLPGRARRFCPGLQVVVMGGATEASIHSTLFEVDAVGERWPSIPYGRPMVNQRVYVLDPRRRPVPVGVVGELYLAGDGLARGYHGLPELTAERFTSWSFGPVRDERLYRTGDLVRFDADGLLHLLGRNDLQVKINGHRIELTGIEAVLRRHPRVRAVALAAQGGRLVAHVVPDGVLSEAELVEHASRSVPASMVPARVVFTDQLPLSPNGKVDRARLPEPPVSRPVWRAPSGDVEQVLARIMQELLGHVDIGADDDFLALGGDSVTAVRLVSRARAKGLQVRVADVVTRRTVAAVAASATRVSTADDTVPSELLPAGVREQLARRYPGVVDAWTLTPVAHGMLFESSRGGGREYLLQTVVRLDGPAQLLTAQRLVAACRALVRRHPALRSAVSTDVADDPVQVVVDEAPPAVRVLDAAWSTVPADLLSEEADRLGALDEAPAVRFAVVPSTPGRPAVVVSTAHHLVLDGWSERVLAEDLAALLAGADIAEAPGPGEFARWRGGRDTAATARAWDRELDGVTAPTLITAPIDGAPPTGRDLREFSVALRPGELRGAPGLGVTRATLAQAAWALVLAERTGSEDVVLGVTVSGRPAELPGIESAVGLFINTVPVRVRLAPGTTVGGLLTGLGRDRAALAEYDHVGLADLHERRGVAALFDTLLVCQPLPGPHRGTVRVHSVESRGVGHYPCTVLAEAERLVVQYDGYRLSAEDAAALLQRFRELADALGSAGPDIALAALRRGGQPGGDASGGRDTAGTGPGSARPAAPARPDPSMTPPPEVRLPDREELCALMAEILGVPGVAPDDDLFALGCNSVRATRIVSRLRRTHDLQVSVRVLFENPAVDLLLAALAAGAGAPASGARPALRRREELD